MQLRNFIRRQKWRLRPLKRVVLPLRNAKRSLVALRRRVPTIQYSARDYRGASFCEIVEVFPAVTIPPPAHPFLPSQSIVHLRSEPAFLFRFKDIDFWARYGGSVVTSDNQLLADLSPEVWGVENHPIFSRFRLPKARNLPGRTAIAVTPEAPGNYYHWLIDLLPRLALLNLAKGGVESFARVLINGTGAHYEEPSLRAIELGREKILRVDARDRFRINDATIPAMDHFSKVIAPWKIDRLRALRDSLPRPQTLMRRLYISRQRAAVRRVINESEFENLLRAADFTIAGLESKSWNEQVAMFAQAEVILAPHGAALANIAFCEPGALIGEIGTRSGYKDFYLQLATSARLRYRFIEARPRFVTDDSSLRPLENQDMIVDLEALEEFLGTL
jgi:capsular polysaccharide biosynthesis protein